jgi:hypothetical protein
MLDRIALAVLFLLGSPRGSWWRYCVQTHHRDFLTVILVGCATPQPAADDQYVAFARSFFELLQHKDFAAAKAKFDGEIEGDTLDTLLQLSVLLIPKDPPLSSKVVQYRSSRVDGSSRSRCAGAVTTSGCATSRCTAKSTNRSAMLREATWTGRSLTGRGAVKP